MASDRIPARVIYASELVSIDADMGANPFTPGSWEWEEEEAIRVSLARDARRARRAHERARWVHNG